MIMQAKATHRARTIKPVHIIENGYCCACKGECKYIIDDTLNNGVVLIYGEECLLD